MITCFVQALRSCSDTPLHVTKHLDLSDKGIGMNDHVIKGYILLFDNSCYRRITSLPITGEFNNEM